MNKKEIYLRIRAPNMKKTEYIPLVVFEYELDRTIEKYKKMGYRIEMFEILTEINKEI